MLDYTESINWALLQDAVIEGERIKVTVDSPHLLVDKVREYFNERNIRYESFSYSDLEPYLIPLSE